MLRRMFLKSLPALAMVMPMTATAAGASMKLKITDIKMRKVRVLKKMGSLIPRPPGAARDFTIGGDLVMEIHTDQGILGIGPGSGGGGGGRVASNAMVDGLKAMLVGKDPFDIETHAYEMYGRPGAPYAEIALWDLIGKAANLPLYKLWGGGKNKIMPYASQTTLGTQQDRPRMAMTVKSQGWRAIKFRTHFETLKEDIQFVEATRKAVGDDFGIMCDANQAGNYPDGHGSGLRWDYKRAVDTARQYERLGVLWLEEPLRRWDYDLLADLNRQVDIPIAGGEFNRGIHEFRLYLEKGCYDVLNAEVMQEGPTVLRQVATLAAAFNKKIVPHEGFMGLGTICAMHLSASWPNAPYVEIKHEPPINDIFAQWSIYENPPALDKEGYIQMSDAPGLGVAVKEDLFEV